MSDTVETRVETGGAKWPADGGGAVTVPPPVTVAALANAAARAAASGARRDLLEYLQLRRKAG